MDCLSFKFVCVCVCVFDWALLFIYYLFIIFFKFRNRYILIASPSWYDKIYRRPFIVLMILSSWLFSFLMMTPPLLGIWGDLGLNPATFSCTILPGEDGKSPKKFFFAFGFLIPCLTIIVSYTCIFIKVKQSRRNVMAHR